jgi:choline dehydrogenase-like flavoprotein
VLQVFSPDLVAGPGDFVIVGSGPAGLALALACEELGIPVLLLESGQMDISPEAQALTTGHVIDPNRHAAPSVAICRSLGGTGRWWGGRCVPFDDIDFAHRPHVENSAWPLTHDDVRTWYAKAADFFGIGSAHFEAELSPPMPSPDIRMDQLERWAPVPDVGSLHRERLAKSKLVRVVTDATVTALEFNEAGTRVKTIVVRGAAGIVTLTPDRVALACGGLESTRLLLAAQAQRPHAFGGLDGALGRFYMGHMSGKIADVIFDNPDSARAHDYYIDAGAYVRRRFTLPATAQMREKLLNISMWVDNPPLSATDHRNGILSLIWLLISFEPIGKRLGSEGGRRKMIGPPPHNVPAHVRNLFRSPFGTVAEALKIFRTRYLQKPAKPWFLIRSGSGRYALHYHCEQSAHAESRVRLSETRDAMGLPYLKIDLKFRETDAQAVVRAHETLDQGLRQGGLGRLEYYAQAHPTRVESVMAQATDGFHQCGTTRMGTDPATSIVDAQCRVHGVENLYVVSSSIFPSSGQANPTFLIAAFAFRLASHINQMTPHPTGLFQSEKV